MDFPIKNGGSFHSFFVCLPEGKPYKSHGAWNCDFALENVPDLFIRSTPISQAKSSESHHLADAFCRALVERQDIEKKSMLENNPYNLCDFIIFYTWISMIYIYDIWWYMACWFILIHGCSHSILMAGFLPCKSDLQDASSQSGRPRGKTNWRMTTAKSPFKKNRVIESEVWLFLGYSAGVMLCYVLVYENCNKAISWDINLTRTMVVSPLIVVISAT